MVSGKFAGTIKAPRFQTSVDKCTKSWVAALVLGLLAFTVADSLHAQQSAAEAVETRLPPDVGEQLEKQAATMAAAHLEFSEEQAGAGVESFYGGPTIYSAYFDANRFYLRTEMHYPGESKRRVHEDAFDGNIFYYGDPDRSDRTTPAILKKYMPGDATDSEQSTPIYFRYFEAAGFYPPQCIGDLAALHSIESLVLQYINLSESTKVEKEGGNLTVTVHIPDPLLVRAQAVNLEMRRKSLLLATRNGRDSGNEPEWVVKELSALKKMQSMVPKRTVRFVLDPKRGYGVVEREDLSAEGRRIVLVQAYKWRYYEDAGIWLPNRCVESYYTGRLALTEFYDRPHLTVTFQLNRVKFGHRENIPFALDYKKSGSLIVDRSTPEAQKEPGHEVVYTVAANGHLLRGSAIDVLNEMNRRRLAPIWIGLNVVIFGVVITVVYVRFKRKRYGKAE